MMKKIFALVFLLVLGKMSYSQYPISQNLGSDSTIVISKGATQSRFVNIVFTDTTQANTQRIKNYPGAQIATNGGGIKLWLRNQTATAWIPVNTGSGNNIYTIDGTLTGNRTLTGGGYPLTFTGLDKFVVSADSVRFTTGDLNLGLNTDSASLTKKISYSGNYRGDYKQFTLVDKGYVDSVVASSPAGTVTSIATNNGSGITGGTITSTGTLAIDTTNVIATKASVSSGLAGKLNISDTASMLGNYLNNVGYGLSKAGQVVSADSATLSNYYLRRKDSLTTTNPLGYVTKQILADTAAAIRSADAGGTVTSVGLTMPAAFNVGNSPITTAGTISVTAAGLVSQYIRGDGTLADFPGGGGGGGASISYYLNGSVNQGTFGGNTYYEMNKTPIFGTGTNFSINADGYIAQFITDAGDPGLLKIPGGNWNFELFFNASSGGGTPTYYVELYKYDGTTFTLIASGSSNPDVITGGTSVEAYFSTLPVPETVLTLTDRLAVRIYVTHAGRTITLHTEDNNLCQVITTFTTGITALNGLTEQVQYFTTGTSGTDFNISSSVATHTFNLPTASATNRGALSTTDWTTFNNKVGGSLISGYIPKATGTNTIDTSQLFQNGQNVGIGTLTPNGRLAIVDTGGFALKINYNSASNVSDSNAAIYAENNGLSSYVAIFNEKTTNNTGAQLPLLIESSLTTGTPQANMGTGMDFGTRDDANNRKLNRFIIRGTDPAAATYTSRAEFRLWNNGVQTTPYYWLGNGNMGLGTSTPDSNLTVVNGAYFQRGIRASGLPAAPGTKALRIDASGTLSYADTLIDAGGTVTSVATNNGTGITGGAITTSGTLAIDTLLISTRAWRQKGIDSVAALINNNISGTTNFIPRFSSANAIDNSVMRQSGTSIGINTSPSYTLDVFDGQSASIGVGTSTNKFVLLANDNSVSLQTTNDAFITFAPQQVAAMRITSGGIVNMGANFANNFNKLNVGGSATIGYTTTVVAPNDGLSVNGSVGIGLNGANTDSALSVLNGVRFQRGVRMSGLPSAVGTKSLRIDASGTVSIADTLTNGVSGSLISGYITKATGANTIDTSQIFQSNGRIGVSTTNPLTKLTVAETSSDGALSILGNSSNVGTFKFYANDGTTIQSVVNSSSSALQIGTFVNSEINLITNSQNRISILNNGNVGIGSGAATDSMLTVENGARFKRGVRMSGLPTAPGTRALRVDANGTLSVSDTLTNGISGSGTTNYIPKFTSSSAIGNSIISESGGVITVNGGITMNGTMTIQSSGIVRGYFGDVDGDNNVQLRSQAALTFKTGGNNLRATLDASGNLGLGVTPSAWGSAYRAFDIGDIGSVVSGAASTFTNIYNNAYVDAVGLKYKQNGFATLYRQGSNDGIHSWHIAANNTSGANASISFTQAMTLTSGGELLIGSTGIYGGGSNNESELLVVGTPPSNDVDRGLISFMDNRAFNTSGLGAKVMMGGRYNNAGAITFFAGLAGLKENTTDGNYAGALAFYTRPDGAASSERMRLTSGGNLGLGVTPSAWGSLFSGTMQNLAGGLWRYSTTDIGISQNAFNDGAGWKYINTATASDYYQAAGQHIWRIAPSGTAGNAISFTQAMTLDASGRLGIGTTSPASRLDVRVPTESPATGAVALIAGTSNGANDIFRWFDGTTQLGVFKNNGNVGIGTTSPSTKLYVQSSDADYVGIFKNTNASGYGIQVYTQGSSTNLAFQVRTNNGGTNAFQVLDNGNVGIGTTNPGRKLDVVIADNTTYTGNADNGNSLNLFNTSTTNETFSSIRLGSQGSGSAGIVTLYGVQTADAAGSGYFAIATRNAGSFGERMRISSAGNVGIGTTGTGITNKLTVLGSETGTQITTPPIGKFINTGNSFSKLIIGSDNSNYDAVMSMDNNATLANTKLRIYIGNGVSSTAGHSNDQIVLQGNGNVGIGTASPDGKLEVAIGTGYMRLNRSGAGESDFSIDASGNAVYDVSIGAGQIFRTNGGSPRMTILSGGNVGIGTTNPIQPLTVAAASNANTIALLGRSSDNAQRIDFYNNAGNTRLFTLATGNSQTELYNDANIPMIFSTNAAERMRITSDGNVALTGGGDLQLNYDRAIRWKNSSGTLRQILAYADDTYLDARDGGIILRTGTSGSATERMRITSGGDVGINTQTPNATFHVNGSVAAAISIKTATYTLTSSDYTVVFDLNGNATANLPSATTCSGRIYVIKINRTNVSDVLTIDPNGAQTIDGNATYDLQCQQAITIQSDGSNWRIIGDFLGGLNCL